MFKQESNIAVISFVNTIPGPCTLKRYTMVQFLSATLIVNASYLHKSRIFKIKVGGYCYSWVPKRLL
jgi:hypothetical protein